MRRETKIGILAIISLFLAIWGFKYLNGKNILSRSLILYAVYDDVNGLQPSAPVWLHGYQVGLVTKLYQKPDELDKIVVVLDIDKHVKLPKDAVAELITSNPMGGKAIVLQFEGHCSDEDCLKSGDFIRAESKGLLASMLPQDEVAQYLELLQSGITALIDSLSSQMGGDTGPMADLTQTAAHIRSLTGRLDGLMARTAPAIAGTLDNAHQMTNTLKASQQDIQQSLANLAALSEQLKQADLGQTIGQANGALVSLQNTLHTTQQTLTQLHTLLENINSGQGTLGKLAADPALYEELQRTTHQAALLLEDLRLHPKRYTRIFSKKEVPYVGPDKQH